MKFQSSLAIALLTLLGSHNGHLLAQSCVNCWINPQTGQQESLEHLIPRQVPTNEPASVVSDPSSPEGESQEEILPNNESDTKEESSPESNTPPPVFDDPVDRLEETEPQPLPRTQVEPRLRYEQQEQRINEE